MQRGLFDIPTIIYFNAGNIWTGSLLRNFSYRVAPIKRKPEDGGNELHVYVWYGTKAFDLVKEFVAEYQEEFSEDGINACAEKLTAEYEKFASNRRALGY